ncbi:1-acyl-sn-glycerol-3-phosphate acyltransferase [Williamsia sterculiae]|uniref:Acyltransferase n=1 Tax=Williamsia sterculiae TaxID=1344003 RepID=A0A1N7CN68_9NOCA|nr:1-acyl-sn-glycerol-3-phosphate acyltransferase [Williamsia sterculiae]SIR64917.1 Acyltransferase [Williamsia sterculiae]
MGASSAGVRDAAALLTALAEQSGRATTRTLDTLTEGDVLAAIARTGRSLGVEFVRRYHRLEICAVSVPQDRPVLFVANHGFGGIFDLNVFALMATLRELDLQRPVTFLVHQIAWTLQVGPLIEPLGARPAGSEEAKNAFARGENVVVLPGGDLDAFKSFRERNTVSFYGRSGFAKLARDCDVPIVPVVTTGAGKTLLVLSRGERLARILGVDKMFRLKALPVSISIPWGVSVGAVGLLPYFPMPSKLRTRVLPPMESSGAAGPEELADQVATAMQAAVDGLIG